MGVCERFASRSIVDSETPSAETVWQVWDEPGDTIANETAAYAKLATVLPTSYTFPSGREANLVNIAIKDIDEKSWDFRVSYSTFEPKQDDDVEYEFDISTVDVNITHALSTASYTGGGRSAPDFKKGVNVSADGKIQGVSVPQPKYTFTLTKYWPIASVTPAYQLAIKSLVGRYNNATFGGYPAGEIRLLGARGRPAGAKWPITYRFEQSDNESGLSIGDITVPTRLGWQYLDVYMRTVADATAKKKTDVPHSVYVHTLPPGAGDFSALGL